MAKTNPIPQTSWAASHLWELRPQTLAIISIAMSLMGVGDGLLVLASLGSTPWTVLSQGIALQTGLSIGTVVAIVSVVVLLLWIPLKLRFGLGTILNIILIAIFIDLTVSFVPVPEDLMVRIAFMVAGILVFGIGTTFYLSCKLGAGPRDGLMVGICQRYGWNVGRVRTSIEVIVCVLGALLGGTLGVSTVVFALSVGWIIQGTIWFLQRRYSQ
ncbi:hypothetical protein B0187_09170 [Haemophilus paracuniculus]|uniref:YitT family protein n=1 Tax=Haemophilus paracuniculus TaxID=734 RepID=A0A1T0AQ66_9PAST|nr:YitT family protein [Haemophilus paracuniculus]OOR98251.1 hypothetical protein B0187_09170 [Haemophilus paracuniculus]